MSGCANIKTISRTSPLGTTFEGYSAAIHLDAQQRVLLSKNNMKKVCAEPSPDVMAAYFSSLGLGVNIFGKAGGSIAQSDQSAIADISLRTQSIVLMRDALFRVCEAALNDDLSEVQVATMLARGMNLVAVVLAVEQLTGAVKASQSYLTGVTNASASSSGSEVLHANTQVLANAIEFRDKQKIELDAAKVALANKTKEVEAKKTTFAKIEEKLNNEKLSSDGISSVTQKEYDTEKIKLAELQADELKLTQKVESSKYVYDISLENVEAIEKTRDASFRQMSVNAVAGTSSSGNFNNTSAISNLHGNSEKNIEHVTLAVKEIVNNAVNKDYAKESCLSLLTSEILSEPNKLNAYDAVKNNCIKLIEADFEQKINYMTK